MSTVKLFLSIVCILFLMSNVVAQEQNISISEDFSGDNLDEALQKLGQHYDLQFAYNSKVFKNIIVTGKFENASIDKVLDHLIKNTDYYYKKINRVFVFYPKNQNDNTPSEPINKDISWSSVVQDFESREVLPYATIVIASSGKGVVCNEDGYFSLFHVPSDTSTIIVSYVGYDSKSFKLNPKMLDNNSPIFLSRNSLIASVPIYREREPMLTNRLTVQELDVNMIKTLPAVGNQDVFNSVQLLSGVDGTGERPGDIRIRGGAADENLVIMDGFTLYHIDHFYQLYSTINASAIKHVRIHKGWFEPKFGGRTSGIIEIQGKEGNLNHSKTEIGLNFNSANLFFETPLEKTKSSVVFAARKSITSLYSSHVYQNQFNTIFNQSSPNLNNGNAFASGNPEFDYSDINVKFNFLLSNKTKVNFSFFSSNDELFLKQQNDIPELGLNITYQDKSTWKNKGYSVRWIQKWTENWFSKVTVGYSNYSSKFLGQDVKKDVWFNLVDTIRNDKTTLLSDLSLRINNDLNLNKHQLSFGVQQTHNKINYKSISPGNSDDETDQNGTLSVLFFQDNFSWKKMQLLGGFRLNYYDILKQTVFVPRVSLTYNFQPLWTGKLFYGQNYQVIRNTQRQDLFKGIADIWSLADDNIPTNKSTQYGIELSKKFEQLEINTSVYQRKIEGATYDLENSPLQFENLENRKFSFGTKYIQGLDFQVIKPRGKHRGWASVSLLNVFHSNHSVVPYDFYDDYDQLIEGKLAYSFNYKQWNFGAVFIYGSGKPYTAALGTYNLELVNGESKKIIVYDLLNNQRLLAYHRLDLSATRYLFIKENIGEIGLAVFNVYGHENTADIRYYAVGRNSDDYELLEKKTPMMGFMPGLKFKFTF